MGTKNIAGGFAGALVMAAGIAGVTTYALNRSGPFEVAKAGTASIVQVSRFEESFDFGGGSVVEPEVVLPEYVRLGQFVYAEAADQNKDINGDGYFGDARRAVAKTMSNRVGLKGYRDSLEEVILADSNYTAVGSEKNKNWKQAIGELERNEYEEKIFQRCLTEASDVLAGQDLGYINQDKWVAYHDNSITHEKLCDFNPAYWGTLQADVTIEDLTFYVPKAKLK